MPSGLWSDPCVVRGKTANKYSNVLGGVLYSLSNTALLLLPLEFPMCVRLLYHMVFPFNAGAMYEFH